MKDIFDRLLEKDNKAKLAEKAATATAAKAKSSKAADSSTNESAEVFRGSSRINLSRQGYQEAHDAARRTANSFTSIHSSPLKRARDTAYIVARKNPQAGYVKPTPALEPWFLGQHEGQPVTPARIADLHDRVHSKPDEPIPGRGPKSTGSGESFNAFLHPLLKHVQHQLVDHKPGDKPLNVTHYRDIQAVKAWLAKGHPANREIDKQVMTEKGTQHPGGLYHLDPSSMHLSAAEKADKPGIYFLRHGATEWNAENKGKPEPNSASKPEPDEKK